MVTGFPVSIYPKKMQEVINEVEKYLGFPRDYICTAILLCAAASIGKTYKLKVRTSWLESCVIFICLLGRPGVNKSHPLSWAIKPLMKATEENFRNSELSDQKKADEMLSMDEPGIVPEQYVANNITPEAMLNIMGEGTNTRFLIWSDELSGFLRNINKYNSGSDTELLLSIFSNQTTLINRKTQQKMMIKDAFACIGGTTQPEVLKSLFKNSESNGLFERFLFTNLDDVTKSKMILEDLNPQVVETYHGIINRLLSLGLNENMEPNVLVFTDEAQKSALDWYNQNVDKVNEEVDDRLCGIFTKLETYFFRFTLILHVVRWSCDEASLDKVDEESVKRAVDLAEYFRHMNVKTLRLLSTDPLDAMTELQRKVYDAIRVEGEFSLRGGIDCASRVGMSERGFKYFLKNKEAFKKVKAGVYKKLL